MDFGVTKIKRKPKRQRNLQQKMAKSSYGVYPACIRRVSHETGQRLGPSASVGVSWAGGDPRQEGSGHKAAFVLRYRRLRPDSPCPAASRLARVLPPRAAASAPAGPDREACRPPRAARITDNSYGQFETESAFGRSKGLQSFCPLQ